jgi:hypothetical protein
MLDGFWKPLKHVLRLLLAQLKFIIPGYTYFDRSAAPISRHASLGKECQHLFSFYCIAQEIEACGACRVLEHKVQDRDNGEECGVH